MKKYFFYGFIFLFLIFGLSFRFILKPFVPVLWQRVDEAFHRGDYKRAESYLGIIAWIEPENPQSYILKGWLEWSEARNLQIAGLPYEEQLKKAVKTYRKGELKNPENWQLYFEEGIMWESFDEKEKSLKAYYKASKYAKPPYSRIYYYKSKKFKMKVKE